MTAPELSTWVTVAATIATALATVVLAGVTWLLFKSTQRMAAATSEPNVIATLEPNRWSFMHLDLLIENTGTGPAFDVQITFDPPLTRDRGGQQTTLPLNAVSILRSGQALRNHVGQGSAFLDRSYRATVSWKATANSTRRTTTSYDLSLRHYDGFSRLGGEAPQVQTAQELKKIREALERWLAAMADSKSTFSLKGREPKSVRKGTAGTTRQWPKVLITRPNRVAMSLNPRHDQKAVPGPN